MSKKLRPDETQEAVEEWSAMIAQMQDSGNDPKWRKKGTKLEQTTNKTAHINKKKQTHTKLIPLAFLFA